MNSNSASTNFFQVDEERLGNVLEGFNLVEELKRPLKEMNLEKQVRVFRCMDTKNDEYNS